MIDLSEVTRSVVRIPVAGPSPNNTLVFVRGDFAGTTKVQRDGKLYQEVTATATVYRVEGFDQTKAQDYLVNTKFSVTGFLALLTSNDDQQFVAAVDSIEGHLAYDGTFYVIAKVATQISDEILSVSFKLSAYILIQEPQADFTGPSPRRSSSGGLVGLVPSFGSGAMNVQPISESDERRLLPVSKLLNIVDSE